MLAAALQVLGTHPNPYENAGPLTVRRIAPDGAVAVTATRLDTQLLEDRPDATGGDDLLVLKRPATVQLLRLTPDGRLRTTWTAPGRAAGTGALARDARGRLALAWLTPGNGLRVATSPDGRTFSRAHAVGAKAIGAVADLAVAVGAGGDPVIAVSRFTATDVLTTTRTGAITGRQHLAHAHGLVATAQTAGGRLGLLIHDTGIEGEQGECVQDGQPRRVWATVAEPRTGRFRAPRRLESQRAYCPDGGAPSLLAGPREQLVVAFGAIPDGDATRTPRTDVAWASDGRPFGPAFTVWPGLGLADAALDPRDGSVVAALTYPDSYHGHGVTVSERAPDGATTASHELSPAGALGALATGAGGRVLAITSADGGSSLSTATP
jgi:hypothetical protein